MEGQRNDADQHKRTILIGVNLSFEGRVRVETAGGEFALAGVDGQLGLLVPSWKGLWELARDRSGRTALAMVAVIPGIHKAKLPVFISGRQLLYARVSLPKDKNRRNPTIRFRLTPLAFFSRKIKNDE